MPLPVRIKNFEPYLLDVEGSFAAKELLEHEHEKAVLALGVTFYGQWFIATCIGIAHKSVEKLRPISPKASFTW